MLTYSSQVHHELLFKNSIFQMDDVTTQFENEEALRESESFKKSIEHFYYQKRNYISKISSCERKKGQMNLRYLQNNFYSYLPPLYQEDLEILQMEEFDPVTFIQRVNRKISLALKEKSGSEFSLFFQDFSSIFGTTYNVRRGYFRAIQDISCHKRAYAVRSGTKLLRMFGEMLNPEDDSQVLMHYLRARKVYDYGKRRGYFPKKKANHVKVYEVISSSSKVSKTKNTGRIMSMDEFLDFYQEKYKGERIRLDEVASEYEEMIKMKELRYREH